jgi:hypothetical protein
MSGTGVTSSKSLHTAMRSISAHATRIRKDGVAEPVTGLQWERWYSIPLASVKNSRRPTEATTILTDLPAFFGPLMT